MKNGRWLLLFLCILLLSACGRQTYEKNMVPFTFIDQHGQPFGTDNLTGSPWIANFIFTNCKTVCPPMTTEMALLQKHFNKEGIAVEFVSFTVDPTVDSPSTLNEYMQVFTDDDSNWHMLTGYSQQEIEIFAREQFQTMVQKPTSSNQVIHGTTFFLFNKEGALVKEYSYIDNSYVEELLKDIKNIK